MASRPPNVLLFFADDQRFDTIPTGAYPEPRPHPFDNLWRALEQGS